MNRFEAKDDQQFTVSREGANGLELRTGGGNVQVVGVEGDQLQIHAARKVRADREADARAFLEQMRIERRRDGDQWVVEATWPDARSHHVESPSVSFEVRLPRGMRLESRTGGGNVEVSGTGETRLNTGGGNVQLRTIGGALNVNTGGGNISLAECEGPVELHTGGGNIDIREARGSVHAQTGGGNIQVEGRSGAVQVNTGGGNIRIHQAQSPVKANTGGGNIQATVVNGSGPVQIDLGTGAGELDLNLPEGASARVEADTGLGSVQLDPAGAARYSRGHSHMEAVLGDGQGSVHLRTGAGGIRVRLAEAR
jgi:DUF4097 and DUF4098 domain-containing protein YvlB